MRRTILAGILLLAACQGSGGGPPSKSPPPPKVILSVQDAAGASGPFAIDALVSLTVGVAYDHVPQGPHALRVDVVSPGGTLYAQLPASIDATGQPSGNVTHTLQVRGTPIQSFRQVGSWKFSASLDGVVMAETSIDLTR